MADLAPALIDGYELDPVEVARITAGTETTNYRVVDRTDRPWFVKVYRDRSSLPREREAIELTEFARSGQVPVPAVRRTRTGDLIQDTGSAAMSVWEYVADSETAEGGLTGARWPAVGAVLGRLHRHLVSHSQASPRVRPASRLRDITRSRTKFDRLVAGYRRHGSRDPFEEWAVEAALQRRALLDRVGALLARLPPLTEQIVHGDLAAPNLLLRADRVAGVIDFQPPEPRFASWEIARIGCDPRTILLGDQWITGLADLLAAYREEHPATRLEDLRATAAIGCAYTLSSTYPLAEPLVNPSRVDSALRAYGRARHEAALLLLDRLDAVEEVLNDHLR